MVDVSRSWLKQWPRKVISMPADRLDGVRKAASWLMDAYRWLPPNAFNEDSKASLKNITPIMLISLGNGSFDLIKDMKGLDRYISKLLISPDEGETSRQGYRKTIFGRFDSLGALWRARSSDIQERWKKMPTKQRETLLSKWSDMNEFRGEAWLSLVQDCGIKRFELRGALKQVEDRAFKWPIINKEILKAGNSLLSFLEARATQAPYLFIRHDANTIEMLVKKLFIDLPWLACHSMYFPRHEDREYYGTLVSDPDMRRTSEEMWAAEKSAKEKKGEPSETEYYEAMYVVGIPLQGMVFRLWKYNRKFLASC